MPVPAVKTASGTILVNPAEKALRCAERDVGPKALSQAGGSLAR